MAEHTIKLETPAPPATPDLQPVISELRERITRTETRLENLADTASLSEIQRLASEAHQLAAQALAKAESAAEHVQERVESASQAAAEEVLPVAPPAAPELPPTPEPDPEPEISESQEHHPWWDPRRYL